MEQRKKRNSLSCPKCKKPLTSVMHTINGVIEPLPNFVVCSKCKKVYKIELTGV